MKGVRRDTADGSRAALLARIVKLLRRGESVALSGLPATGKTYLAEKALAQIGKDERFVVCRCPVTERMVEAGKKANFSEVFFDAALKALSAATGHFWGTSPRVSKFQSFRDALRDVGEYDGRHVVLFVDDFDTVVRECRVVYDEKALGLVDEICAKLSYLVECGQRVVDDKTGLCSKHAFNLSLFLVSGLTPRLIEGHQWYKGGDLSWLLRDRCFTIKPMGADEFNDYFRCMASGRRISIGARNAIRRYSCGLPEIAQSLIAAYDEKIKGSDSARFEDAVRRAGVEVFAYRECLKSFLDLGLLDPAESDGMRRDTFLAYGLPTTAAACRGTFLESLIRGIRG